MKKYSLIFLVFLLSSALVFLNSINAWAYIECDGKVNIYEWDDCDRSVLFNVNDVSGCRYHSICVKYKYIEQDSRIYIGLVAENTCDDIEKAPQDAHSELYISFNDSSEIVLYSDADAEYNEEEFSLNYGVTKDMMGGVSYEADVILKEVGFDETLKMYIQIKDYEDNLSRVYEVDVKSEELKEKESESIAESEKISSEEAKKNATKKNSSRTTKPKTTKAKETTTEFLTAHITEEYVEYSENLKKNNRAVIGVGVACVVISFCAMCISLFKKDKDKK